MGGKEGSRGYLYQTFACVLQMLTIKNWSKVYIEYKTENDKVDIAFEENEGLSRVIQVKSSINLFTKEDILTWLEELLLDIKSKEYEVFLIGSVNDSANKLIKSINKKQNNISDKESRSQLKGLSKLILSAQITITIIPFSEEILQSIVRDNLNRYISFKGATIQYEGLEMLSSSINMTMMLLSSLGEGISKVELDEKIFRWLQNVTSNYMKISEREVQYEVGIYSDEKRQLEKTMSQRNLIDFYSTRIALKDLTTKVHSLIEEIKLIKIEKSNLNHVQNSLRNCTTKQLIEPSGFEKKNLLQFSASINKPDLFSDIATAYNLLELSDIKKMEYLLELKEYFKIECDESIFYLDNLSQSALVIPGFMKPEIKGSDESKLKYDLINRLLYEILRYKCIVSFVNDFKNMNIVKIGIRNIGNVFDSDVRVQLFIPSSVGLYDFKNYNGNKYIPYLSEVFMSDEGIFSFLFENKSDCNLIIEKSNEVKFREPYPLLFVNGNSRIKYSQSDFNDSLSSYFNNRIVDETDDFIVLDFKVNEIYQNELKGAKELIALNYHEVDYEIKYRIYSKNSNGDILGSIIINNFA